MLNLIIHKIAHLFGLNSCMNDVIRINNHPWHRVYCITCGKESFRFPFRGDY